MKWRRALLGLIGLPATIEGYFIVLVTLIFGFSHKPHKRSHGVLVTVWRPWFAKRWKYSNNFGRGIVMHPEHVNNKRVWEHELVHLRQTEDQGAIAWCLVAILWPWVGFWPAFVVFATSTFWSLTGNLTAWIRTGDGYWEAEHERSAYFQTGQRKP